MLYHRKYPRNYEQLRKNPWKYVATWTFNKKYGIVFLKKKFHIKLLEKKKKTEQRKKKNCFSEKLPLVTEGKYNLTITITNNNTFINFSEIIFKIGILKKEKKSNMLKIKDKNKTLTYISGGLCGFIGSQKSTAEANTTMARNIANKINNLLQKKQNKTINVFLKGRKKKARVIMKEFLEAGLNIKIIKKVIPNPHNGCRRKKIKRT